MIKSLWEHRKMDLALRDDVVVKNVVDFAVRRHLLCLQPEAHSSLFQQLHSQLWLQRNYYGKDGEWYMELISHLKTSKFNTNWFLLGYLWSWLISSSLFNSRKKKKNKRMIVRIIETFIISTKISPSFKPTFCRESVAGWSTISMGDKTRVNADVLFPGSIKNSFGPVR